MLVTLTDQSGIASVAAGEWVQTKGNGPFTAHVMPGFTGSFTIDGANVKEFAGTALSGTALIGTPVALTGAEDIQTVLDVCAFMRIRVTAYTSGSLHAILNSQAGN